MTPKTIHVDLSVPHCWLAVRVENTSYPVDWHILGVYTTEAAARNRCKLPNDSILALPLDVDLPDEICSTDNEEFPLAENVLVTNQQPKTDPYEPIPTGFLIEQACPFCGAWFAYLHHVTDDNRQHVCKIVCLRCGAGAPDNVGDEFHSTVEKSVAAWNERPPEQANRDRYTKHKDNSEE